MQKALLIVDDEKTDGATAKFMVGAFKKCFNYRAGSSRFL